MSDNGFPKLPKGYKWEVDYFKGTYDNYSLRVRIVRWGWWSRYTVWRNFQEDEPPFKPYKPTPEEIRGKGIEYAQLCWVRFTKTGVGDEHHQAAFDLMNDLNSGRVSG